MAFDWMQVNGARAPRAGAHEDMFRAEIVERAVLLRTLGYSKAAATARIGAAARWEYLEPSFSAGAESLVGEVDALVAGVFDKT